MPPIWKYPLPFVWLLLLPISSFSQTNYQVSIDLTNVVDDQLEVSIKLPEIQEDTIEFRFPKIVPGTYSIYDFGRFISGFRAYDSEDKLLEVEELTANRKLIKEANKLSRITYWVEDTYDTDKGNFVFEPAGTNISDGKNFVLNTFGFIGYLEGHQNLPYSLEIKHPSNLYGGSALQKVSNSDSLDTFTAPNYFDLADGPIMYNEPDTVTFNLGDTEIMVSVYSPNKVSKADLVGGYIRETLEAQAKYLDGKLPVDRYVFLIYHFNGVYSKSLSLGALEHSYSSLYSLPELHPLLIAQTLKDIVAHEFFHIVTPLNIHSEEIASFDFIDPKMSKHLWLYEGVTEYAAGLAQVKYGQMDLEQYVEVILSKIKASGKYDDSLPFTELSEKCLKEHKSQYGNVYQKGALIGLCLDITLRNLSAGKYGIQELMKDLSNRYGKDEAFKDGELFSVISELTFPEIRDFFRKHVEGSEELPLVDLLRSVGLNYAPKSIKKELSLGNISFKTDELKNQLIVTNTSSLNTFGKALGFKTGDIIDEFDGININAFDFEETFETFKKNRKAGDKIDVYVLRKNSKDKLKRIKLSGRAVETEVSLPFDLKLNPNPTIDQLNIRKSWINK
jgi:predicted metalloprotease with PDZ domain